MGAIGGSITGLGVEQYYFYFIVGIFLIFSIAKFTNYQVNIAITFIFFLGLFAFLGGISLKIYKVIIFVSVIAIAFKRMKIKSIPRILYFNVMFVILSIVFWLSVVNNASSNVSLFNVLNQYNKLLIPFLAVHIFIYESKYYKRNMSIQKLIFWLIYIQIFFAIIKFIIIGFQEGVVGSLSYSGGHVATIFPVFGFILLWYKKGERFKRKDWLTIIGLMLIGFMSMKRAIWFIMPIMILLIIIFVSKRYKFKTTFKFLPLVILIFYLGVRTNPSLNIEKSFWGSFDISYVLEFADDYTFGDEDKNREGSGRGGGLISLISQKNLSLFGDGIDATYLQGYDTFDDKKYGVFLKSSLSGTSFHLISFGIAGFTAFIMYLFSWINLISNRKLRIVMTIFLLWEYILYKGILFEHITIGFLFSYIIIYTNNYYIIKHNIHHLKEESYNTKSK
jgi:hypothetical protein